jgi:hypothetical protein
MSPGTKSANRPQYNNSWWILTHCHTGKTINAESLELRQKCFTSTYSISHPIATQCIVFLNFLLGHILGIKQTLTNMRNWKACIFSDHNGIRLGIKSKGYSGKIQTYEYWTIQWSMTSGSLNMGREDKKNSYNIKVKTIYQNLCLEPRQWFGECL